MLCINISGLIMKVVFDTGYNTLQFVGKSTTLQVAKTDDKPENNLSYLNSKVIPAVAILGGGVLLYLGLRGPDKNKIFERAIGQKLEQIKGFVRDFESVATDIVSNSFYGADKYIETYKKNYNYDFSGEIQKIKNAETSKEVIKNTKSALSQISQMYTSENKREGATIFDKFIVAANNEANFLRGNLWKERLQRRCAGEDIVHFVFEDFHNPEKIEQGKIKLKQAKNLADSEMEAIQEQKIADRINEKSVNLAQNIDNSRQQYLLSRREIINNAIEKLKQLNSNPEDFEEILGQNPIFFKSEDLSKTYANLSLENNLADIKLIIRLLEENTNFDKKELSKIKILTNKLQNKAEKDLIALCKIDFDALTPQQARYNLYRINTISQKLGYPNLEQMEARYSKVFPEFSTYGVKRYIPLTKTQPEVYFS